MTRSPSFHTAALLLTLAACGGGDDDAPGKGKTGGPTPGTCQESYLSYHGTVDGAAVAVSDEVAVLSDEFLASESWRLSPWAPPSHLLLWGYTKPVDQGVLQASEVLLRGGWSGAQDSWYCARDVPVTRTRIDEFDSSYTLSLPELARIGTCPGTPVEGSLSFCYGGSAIDDVYCDGSSDPSTVQLTGTVDGVEISSSLQGHSFTSSFTAAVIEYEFNQGGVLRVTSSPDSSGVLLLPDANGTSHTVYCLGTVPAFDAKYSQVKMTLTGLSRLGTCADAKPAGSLDVCF